jgi:hypothetical protein
MDVYARPDGSGSVTIETGTTCLGTEDGATPRTDYHTVHYSYSDRQQPCFTWQNPAYLWCAIPVSANDALIVYKDGRIQYIILNLGSGGWVYEYGR